MRATHLLGGLAALVLSLPAVSAGVADGADPARGERATAQARRSLEWNARNVEHLYNRAGFGATPAEVAAALARRPEEVVEQLVSGGAPVEPFYVKGPGEMARVDRRGLSDEQRQRLRRATRRQDRFQMGAYTNWWIEVMASGADPLRDRMALFWHGFFTSSYRDVRNSVAMARQHQMLRAEALGNYGAMLRGIVHDPGMLKYLDNDANRKGNNNENLARELLELFSLGEGNYTEDDVKNVARALTGMRVGIDGEYDFRRRQHDFGRKEILGEEGRFNGDDVVDILLEQEACARWVAGSVIEYLEGVPPTAERLDFYAALLREANYDLAPMLRSLLLDPAFYRDEVVGTRVQGPVDYLVGCSRRLDMPLPAGFVREGAAELGQELFFPPSVKGWDEGTAWITTSSLMLRGNLAGMALGVVEWEEVLAGRGLLARAGQGRPADDEMMSDEMMGDDGQGPEMDDGSASDEMMGGDRELDENGRPRMPRQLRDLRSAIGDLYQPRINLAWRYSRAGVTTDAAIADRMLDAALAIDPPADLREQLTRRLAQERAALGLEDGALLDDPSAEDVLRRALHWLLATPAAQLS